jgi:hypothetical protein
MDLTPAQQFLIDLERERYSTAWRAKPEPKHQPQIVYVPAKVDAKKQRERDRIMFNAGRFAAGDRDDEATKANNQVAKLIKKG